MMEEQGEAEGGFTFVEVTIVMTILVGMILIVSQLFLTTNQAQEVARRLNMTTDVTREVLQDIRAQAITSVRLFENNAVGNAYLGLLDLTGVQPAINSTLPTIDVAGNFRQEAGPGVLTGNTLLFARHDWTDEFTCLSGNSYLLEIYRLVRIYLRNEDGGPQPGTSVGLNLCRWVGEPMVDGSQVNRISDPVDQAEVLEHLRLRTPDADGVQHPSVALVWIVGEDPAALDTFRQIEPTGTLSSTPVAPRSPTWEVLQDPVESSAELLFRNLYSVATNYAPSKIGLGKFSVLDTMGDGFPHGFEVQIIGPSSGRQVLLHLIVVNRWPRLPITSSQKIIINTRDV